MTLKKSDVKVGDECFVNIPRTREGIEGVYGSITEVQDDGVIIDWADGQYCTLLNDFGDLERIEYPYQSGKQVITFKSSMS